MALAVVGGVVSWSIVAAAIFAMDAIGAGNVRDQAAREQALYEERLNALADQRDAALAEAAAAHDRFDAALSEVSAMQTRLLEAETRTAELRSGIETTRGALTRAMEERDAARGEARRLANKLDGDEIAPRLARMDALEATLDVLAAALDTTATQRDAMASDAATAEAHVEDLILRARLEEDRNDRIFAQLEDALTISVAPLDTMFEKAGLDTDSLLSAVRRDYGGQGGALTPITMSTKGVIDPDSARANDILERLDRMNLYRLASEKAPFALPLKSNFRFTSGFGPRWGRMHNGTDFAGAHGSPIYATADGVVTHAGWQSGYGRLVKIRHDFGIETRYAHKSRIRVKVGQRVSRGDHIGDMGNTGRSTGTHLHYEVRVNGRPVNPMIYIKAASDVF